MLGVGMPILTCIVLSADLYGQDWFVWSDGINKIIPKIEYTVQVWQKICKIFNLFSTIKPTCMIRMIMEYEQIDLSARLLSKLHKLDKAYILQALGE